MGIKGLAKFLADNAPGSVKQQEVSSFTGQVLAVDASMTLYQFMIAIRDGEGFQNLTNEAGETTSHISGILSRVIRLMENGIKPVYVFDGKPPTLKSGELALRRDRREQAEKSLADAQETGDKEAIKKFTSRTVKVTPKHNDDVKRLLRLMGVPVVEAPCEAEAQCAVLCIANKVYAVATEDADALTFGSSILVRNLNFSDSKAKGNPILTFHLKTALEELSLSMDQFIDFCILCGCDYAETIRGIGPHTAFNLIRQHGSIENVIVNIDTTKHPIPDNFPFEEARQFFKSPDVTDPTCVDLKWSDPDVDGLRHFLVTENSFNEQRVENYLSRLRKAKGRTAQTRLESFFGAPAVSSSKLKEPPVNAKAKGKAKAKPKAANAAHRGLSGAKRKKPPSPLSGSTASSTNTDFTSASLTQTPKRAKGELMSVGGEEDNDGRRQVAELGEGVKRMKGMMSSDCEEELDI